MGAEARLTELGIVLPKPVEPVANYIRARRVGNTVFVSGHGPAADSSGKRPIGKVGRELTLEQGYQAARLVGLNLLASLKAEIGSLDRVKQIVKLLGMVNCAPGFDQTPRVINGCSDLLVEVFGTEIGQHARSAVGMAELPSSIPVEIEMIVEVEAR
ncbi:MAG TPA: RidA family protein [Chloroflexota bacterium]|nr:RidA family protein [Chloroflexota bacterium]